jgi:ATP-binding cassette, subfamily B (MDR/TAP), member 1
MPQQRSAAGATHSYNSDNNQSNRRSSMNSSTKLWLKTFFSFTTQRQLPLLISGIILATIGGLLIPAQSILFGLIFREFSDFGAHTISASDMSSHISKYCLYLVCLGGASWILNAAGYTTWLAFTELNIRQARKSMFSALLEKTCTWYDMQEHGIEATISLLQG